MAENDHTDSTRNVKRIDISDIDKKINCYDIVAGRLYLETHIIEAFGISKPTFRKLKDAGLKGVKPGNKVFYRGEKILEAMEMFEV